MESKREAVKDILRAYLEKWFCLKADSAYEHACNLADCIFYALGVSDAEQDEPPDLKMPRRLPVVTLDGESYFLDVRLGECRNVTNPHDTIPLQPGRSVK